ncbi:MAG TPA: hypothetical protein VFK96_07200 [Gammaproteobacteria bacterium]|nr:hypothetical protein [Gammaproteobacteria bacterium]
MERAGDRTERAGGDDADQRKLALCGGITRERHDDFRWQRRKDILEKHQQHDARIAAGLDRARDVFNHVSTVAR